MPWVGIIVELIGGVILGFVLGVLYTKYTDGE